MLNIDDLMQTDGQGRGMVNILAADQLMQSPRLYSTFLLWLLSELFEQLPEIGDPDKPKIAFFFDEAHLLFNDAPKVLIERIELVVRLVRSKGVGVYFVTQNPMDIPDSVLAQLGNRVQHALRAFTPKDQKAVKATAQTMRPNPEVDIEAAITELAVGEALISFLDAKGRPGITERVYVVPPGSHIGPIEDTQRRKLLAQSLVAGIYEKAVDRESAYEVLQARAATSPSATGGVNGSNGATAQADAGLMGGLNEFLFGSTGPRGGKKDGLVQSLVKSTARNMTNQLGRQLLRGVLGSLTGSKKR
ncbi:MAG: helicase HerA-like domain-containing protein, partial [Comamonas sp.]